MAHNYYIKLILCFWFTDTCRLKILIVYDKEVGVKKLVGKSSFHQTHTDYTTNKLHVLKINQSIYNLRKQQ